jgi:hypothetical protein
MCGPDSIDWEDIGLAGALAEELAAEERERQWLLKQVEPEADEDYKP